MNLVFELVFNKRLIRLVIAVGICWIYTGCGGINGNKNRDNESNNQHKFVNIFGDEMYASGDMVKGNKDSIEVNSWLISNKTNPVVLYGNYVERLPIGDWKFGMVDNRLFSSQWDKYRNDRIACTFAIPFRCEETLINSTYVRLRTTNDSLGKISIIVGVTDTLIPNEKVTEFGLKSEIGLREQGYSFSSKKRQFVKESFGYEFAEYFMKDSAKRDVKLYRLFGSFSDKHRFVEFLFFHDGPKETLVKTIFSLMVSSVYINNERFFNPYIK